MPPPRRRRRPATTNRATTTLARALLHRRERGHVRLDLGQDRRPDRRDRAAEPERQLELAPGRSAAPREVAFAPHAPAAHRRRRSRSPSPEARTRPFRTSMRRRSTSSTRRTATCSPAATRTTRAPDREHHEADDGDRRARPSEAGRHGDGVGVRRTGRRVADPARPRPAHQRARPARGSADPEREQRRRRARVGCVAAATHRASSAG